MALTPAQSTALTTELLNDPQTYGYAADRTSGNDQALVDKLNKPRDGTDGEAAISVPRRDVLSADILEAVDLADFPVLPTNPNNGQLSSERRQLTYLEMLMNVPTLRLQDAAGADLPIVSNLSSMFPAGTATRTRLLALRTRTGSRAEQLFGTGVRVTVDDVARALGRT